MEAGEVLAMRAYVREHIWSYFRFLLGSALLVIGILALVHIYIGVVVHSFVAGIVGFVDFEIWRTVLLALLSFVVTVTGAYILRRA